MTGYGRVSEQFKDLTITVEIRSLNSKFTDLRIKLPQNYRDKEPEIRRMLTDYAERGKLDFTLDVKTILGDEEYSLNLPLFRRYHRELTKLAQELQLPMGDIMSTILKMPNVVTPEQDFLDEEEWANVQQIITKALDAFQTFRQDEGKVLEEDIRTRIANIQALLSQVDPYEEERISKLRQRIHQNLEEYLGKDKIDENRFEQEIIFYLEKIDINEEKVRLAQHCNYFLEELDANTAQKGRKLSFISQEIGREINTLGAKAYSSDIQRFVVNMKDELEKIKEQVANSV